MPESSTVQLTRTLIQIPSTPASGSRAMAMEIADRLDLPGLTTQTSAYGDGQVNVMARWGDPDHPSICLSGHLDTVPVTEADWQHDPFGGEILDGRLYGRGSVDMKAGLAALMTAVRDHVRDHGHLERGGVLLLTAEEELGSVGATAALDQITEADPAFIQARPELLLIAEPTSTRISLGHRGALWLDLVASGRPAHASTPHLGESAVWKIVDALAAIRAWSHAATDEHPDLGRRTLSIGRIEGGVLRNVVPAHAQAQLDIRTPFAGDADTVPAALRDLVGDLVDVVEVLNLPAVFTDPGHPIVRGALAIHGQASEPVISQYFTDASVLTPGLGGPPTLICGPGSPDNAHVVDEWCPVAEIDEAAGFYRRLLQAHSHRHSGE